MLVKEPGVSHQAPSDSRRERRQFVLTLADEVARVDHGAPHRIGMRRLAVGTDAMQALARPHVASLDEATRTITRADNRDTVAQRVLETVARFMPTAASAMLLNVRGSVAVELDQTIDRRLLAALGAQDADLVVVPLAVADQSSEFS